MNISTSQHIIQLGFKTQQGPLSVVECVEHFNHAVEMWVILFWNCEEMTCHLERTRSEFAEVLLSVMKGFYVYAINLKSVKFFTYFMQYLIASVHKSLMITDIKCTLLQCCILSIVV